MSTHFGCDMCVSLVRLGPCDPCFFDIVLSDTSSLYSWCLTCVSSLHPFTMTAAQACVVVSGASFVALVFASFLYVVIQFGRTEKSVRFVRNLLTPLFAALYPWPCCRELLGCIRIRHARTSGDRPNDRQTNTQYVYIYIYIYIYLLLIIHINTFTVC